MHSYSTETPSLPSLLFHSNFGKEEFSATFSFWVLRLVWLILDITVVDCFFLPTAPL